MVYSFVSSSNDSNNKDAADVNNNISFISPCELGDEQKYITKAEEELRVLVNDKMTDNFGSSWMSLPNGLGEETVQKLKARQEEEAKTLRNNRVQAATNLLDYCYIHQLKEIIVNEKNWGQAGFSDIFPSIDRTRTTLQILSEFRNPEMHGRATKLLFPHQKHLCIGLAGELLLIVEQWRMGFKQKVKSYEFHFHFKPPVASNATDASSSVVDDVSLTEQQQQQQLIEEVEKWVESFKAKTNVNVVEKSDNNNAFVYTLSVLDRKGNLTISFEKAKEGNCRPMQRNQEWYIHLMVTTDKLALIDWIMKEEEGGLIDRPYWVYRINMKDRLEAANIKARIKEVTGQKPTGWANNTLFNYPFGNFDDADVRLTLKDDGQIEISIDGSSIDIGFYQAHKYFTYQVILYALYGELTPAYKHQLIKEACSKPSK